MNQSLEAKSTVRSPVRTVSAQCFDPYHCAHGVRSQMRTLLLVASLYPERSTVSRKSNVRNVRNVRRVQEYYPLACV